MADESEIEIPTSDDKRKSIRFLPAIFRSDANKKFLAGTMDPLIQSGYVRRLNGFIGRQNAKAVTGKDVYIEEPLTDRQNYQLEPCLISEDNLGNVTFFKDYIDYINTISVLGGITTNHQRINHGEFYSWEPHIDWDKVVNYLQYYWMPYGPDTIPISGKKTLSTESTFNVTLSDEQDNMAYVFTPDGLTRDPDLRLYRGETYRFVIDTPNEPFSIKTERLAGEEFRYTDGVVGHAIEHGVVEFTVPFDAPDLLYYVSEKNVDSSGIIKIFDIEENTEINVEEEIVGKKTYKLSNGVELSNGMKVRFIGRVTPEEYALNDYYVEGVGEAIQLISEKTLEVVADYANYVDVSYDSIGFDNLPFNNINYAAQNKDYITINRSSRDRNPWSRYNRWVHQDVIIRTAEILGKQPLFDQSQRAIRPIIEFKSNIRLFNFGVKSKKNVDLIDDYTQDVFSTVEGSLGYNVDGISLLNGHRIIFTADKDPIVKNKIYRVEFLNIYDENTGITTRKIHLAEEPDAAPLLDETVLILGGLKYSGSMLWFDGSEWIVGQSKKTLNQAPLFDLYDSEGVSLTNSIKYPASTFTGTPIFSYKVGTGTKDKELGFALSYKNINNIGDIVFSFDLLNDSFSYKYNLDVISEQIDNKFLKRYSTVGDESFVNGWTRNKVANTQPIVRVFKNEYKRVGNKKQPITNFFPLDIFDSKEGLEDLVIKVYVNNKRLKPSSYSIVDGPVYKEVLLDSFISENDIVTVKCYTKKVKNDKGYYEFPINFQNNSLNNNIEEFTLGEVIDHVDSIVDNLQFYSVQNEDNKDFDGIFPGLSNLRNIGGLSALGTKFVQHIGSINLSLYHLTDNTANILKAIDKSRDDYGKFKRSFAVHLEQMDDSILPKDAVDLILVDLNQGKSKLAAYYFSDMLAYGPAVKNTFTVKDAKFKKYPLSELFDLEKISVKAVYVYLNNKQLTHGLDYVYTKDGFVDIHCDIKENDIIVIHEYENTDRCYVPSTPTKLGLYPVFEPKIYLDTTLIEPRNVIQGHDGSIMLAFNDFRDDIILELELRIFNNIKVKYDPKLFDIYNFVGGSNRSSPYSLEEFNRIIAPNFFKWTRLIDTDFTKQLLFLRTNPFTYNYSEAASIDNTQLAGFWRGIYKWYFDTDRIHICPWESLGFSIKPKWWEQVYGPAPYTSDNLILWQDLRDGIIREPGRVPQVNPKFKRPILDNIPVDEQGNLLDPIQANFATTVLINKSEKNYVFGDQGPVETTWRRSSYYPFSLLKTIILMNPSQIMGLLLDRTRIFRNNAGQIVYKPTGLRLRLEDLQTSSVANDATRVQTAGLINYIIDYLVKDNTYNLNQYRTNLKTLTNKLSHRIAGYTSKEKFNILLDSKSANSTSSVFVPKENYKIFLNSSSPIKKLYYSGVVITKSIGTYGSGYEIKGYNQAEPFFKYYPWTQAGRNINVGGVSESFITWDSGQRYLVGNLVKIDQTYYRVKVSHTSSSNPDFTLLQKLPEAPMIGGVDANIRQEFSSEELVLSYGTVLTSIQEVVDFLLGYGEYLKSQGFKFDVFNKDISNITDWEYSVKEFLFWTTQNWSSGQDKYTEWENDTKYDVNDIVYYDGNFYKSLSAHTTGNDFNEDLYIKIESLNQDGAAAITLSPSALDLNLGLSYSVVDDIRESNNEYEIFGADGVKYEYDQLKYLRYNDTFSLKPLNVNRGVYGASLYLVQKEHVLVIDNVTQFNDLIYNIETGYRQERIFITGYKTINWNGSFDAPGFIYDRAKVQEWNSWTDYKLGDIVKYKEFYYAATTSLIGSETFEDGSWVRLDAKPESQLLPNWNYKALQFTDFYDLDSDNFDVNQQRVAQHLIGYQKRQYLENIIKNDVSEFKFYQGMITEKGTPNSLNKLFDVLSAADQASLDFIEEWAVRVGQYGASEAFEEVEFVLDEGLFKADPQAIELVPSIDTTKTDFVIRQTKNDIYLKPRNYIDNLWPKNENFRPFLKTPGFVRTDHAKYAIDQRDDILNLDITTLTSGDYIWCGFEPSINEFGDDWNIYRFSHLDINIVTVTSNNLTFNINPEFVVGDIVGFTNNTNNFNKFFKITSVNQKTVTVNAASFDASHLKDYKVYKITNQRFKNIDDLKVPKFLNPVTATWNYGELVWFKENENEIWQNIPIYSQSTFTDSVVFENNLFGSRIVISKDATVILVSKPTYNKQVFVYKKVAGTNSYIKTQLIDEPADYIDFGRDIAISDDNKFVTVSGVNDNNNGVVWIYELDDSGEYKVQDFVINPDVVDEFFGYKTRFAISNDVYYMYVSSTDSISISGKIYVFKLDTYWGSYDTIGPLDNLNEEPFAYAYDVNQDGSILALTSCLNDGGKVFWYKRQNNQYVRQSSVINLPNDSKERFGFDVSLSSTGNLLAVSSTMEDINYLNQGRVRLYKLNNAQTAYNLFQVLDNRNAESDEEFGEQFGYKVKFTNNDRSLMIFSKYGDSSKVSVVGEDSTTINFDSGRVDIYDQYLTKFIFSESLPTNSSLEGYGTSVDAANNTVVVSAPASDNGKGKIYVYIKPNNEYSWKKYLTESPKVDIEAFKKIFLYNRKSNSLISYLDIIDPIQGNIAGVADQEIKYKTYYDPAIYSFKTNEVTVNIDEGMCWLDKQVGTLWWDLRRAKFIDPTMGSVVYRNSTWNQLFPTASIDICEWVSTRYTPNQWDQLSSTDQGTAAGVSGKSLYGNKAYSVKKVYDTVSKSFTSTYYYWVKDKTITPNFTDRKISAVEVASLIRNPKNNQLKYIEFLDLNAMSLANVQRSVSDKDVVLSVQYWQVPNKEKRNIHSEWKIVSENEKTELPKNIERKWIDSLVGFDENGKMVPDVTLSPKQQYGIEFRPRQSMFVNRIEAVKQIIERFNYEIKQIQVDNVDLSDLFLKDEMPSAISGKYDYVKDTDQELRFIVTDNFINAKIDPVILNGVISGITIVSPGLGYKNSPTIKINGAGVGASIKLTINSAGSVVGATILNGGKGYDSSNTSITVRPLTALVISDTSTVGFWSLYEYNPVKTTWYRVKTQEYDVTKFWSYIDWYKESYGQYTKINHMVNGINELFTLDARLGDIVKVNNIGSSKEWILLEKYSDIVSLDYTKSYKVVGKQNGTIQISSFFYNFSTNKKGFDGPLYDSNTYDNAGTVELRIILNSLKNKILIDDRRIIYLNLFFVSLRYILFEQPFVDWVFKTSFVKALHNVGPLRQKVTHKNDNLSDFEKYILEVKPYRTKIREYVSIYSNLDYSQSMITDFDLPSYINDYQITSLSTLFKDGVVTVDNNSIVAQTPWKFWKDSLGFVVDDIIISDAGDGYIERPLIKFEGECTRPARAMAYIVRGQIAKIEILDKGEGYFAPPKVILDGSVNEGGHEAKVYSVIGTNLARTNSVEIKFDRVTKEKTVSSVDIEESFTGDGSSVRFSLKYSPVTSNRLITVLIDNVEQVSGSYIIEPKYSTTRGHKVYYADLVFVQAPNENSAIQVSYKKDFMHLNASERIQNYYTPTSGMIGLDFAQLMTGIDYGGVNVMSLGFEKPNSWDSGNFSWAEKPWDQGAVSDQEQYDTLIDGGNIHPNSAYRTATGLRADDIIIDGDGFITPMTSPAPEEMLPGHVSDAVAIKVYERKLSTSSDIITNVYETDGISAEYKVQQYANNKKAILVKIGETILDANDYEYDYDNSRITLNTVPDAKQIVSITSLGFNGENLIETNFVKVTAKTKEIITDAKWEDDITGFTLVSGEIRNHVLFKTDSNYDIKNLVGIRFPFEVDVGQVVNYSLFKGQINQSIVSKESLTTNGTSRKYYLTNPVGKKVPWGPNVIVRVGNLILNSVDSFRFTLRNRELIYDIPAGKANVDIYSLNDYQVYLDGQLVELNTAYSLDLIASQISIKSNYYKENSEVIVAITKDAEYFVRSDVNGTYIEFQQILAAGTNIEIMSMYNHDILSIERTYYKIETNLADYANSVYYLDLIQVSAGIFRFNRKVENSSYVWVIKNKKILTPNVDYILLEDKESIRLAGQPTLTDRFNIITFSGNIVRNPVSFMQFKDMMNRTYYKRLSKNRTTVLAKELKAGDKEIILADSSKVGVSSKNSNTPGVLYINGERIEYFYKVGDKVSQLRRGTYGTGVPLVHAKGTQIHDIGQAETIPYEDENIVYTIDSASFDDSTNTASIPFVPTKDNVEVFIGTKRLKKNSYKLHSADIHPESPEGDVDYAPDFTTDSINHGTNDSRIGYIVFEEKPPEGVPVTVVVKTLRHWSDPDKSLSESENRIANFLKFDVELIEGTEPSVDSGLYSTDSDDISVDDN